MAAKMTEKEYDEFKRKTGHREPQKVTTYYKEHERHETGVKHHRERAAQNRDVVSLPGSIEKKLTGSTRVTTATRQTGGEIREKAGRVKERVAAPFRPVKRAATPYLEDFGKVFGRGGGRTLPNYGFHFGMPNMAPHAMQMGEFGPVIPVSAHERRKRGKGVRKESGSVHWEELGGVPDDVKRWM